MSLIPGVRDPKGKCVDAQNCDFERWTVCAFDEQPTQVRVEFLDCLDSPWTDELTVAKVKACANSTKGVDTSQMEHCYAGARGDQLLDEASRAFTAAYPKPVYMPRVRVAGVDVPADYDDVKNALCSAGAASPVCG